MDDSAQVEAILRSNFRNAEIMNQKMDEFEANPTREVLNEVGSHLYNAEFSLLPPSSATFSDRLRSP